MCGIRTTIAKDHFFAANPCMARIFSHDTDATPFLHSRLYRWWAGARFWAIFRFRLRAVLQYVETGQKKPCTEVTPVDTSVNCRRGTLYPLRSQSIGQFFVAPPKLRHATLDPRHGFISPHVHRVRFRRRPRGLGIKRNGATGTYHFTTSLLKDRQLRSILSHPISSHLYFYSTFMEATQDA